MYWLWLCKRQKENLNSKIGDQKSVSKTAVLIIRFCSFKLHGLIPKTRRSGYEMKIKFVGIVSSTVWGSEIDHFYVNSKAQFRFPIL